MSRAVWPAGILLSTLLFGIMGCADTTEPTPSQGAPARGGAAAAVTAQDQRFVAEAVPAGFAEVELSRLAAERASHPQVRTFAQRMVDDHSETNERLLAFAKHYQIDVPKRVGREHQQTKETLNGLEGEAFDRAYMQGQVKGHETALMVYQRQAEQGKAAALQALAQTTAPILEEHLKAAQAIARNLAPP